MSVISNIQFYAGLGIALLFTEALTSMPPGKAALLRACTIVVGVLGAISAWEQEYFITSTAFGFSVLITFIVLIERESFWDTGSRLLAAIPSLSAFAFTLICASSNITVAYDGLFAIAVRVVAILFIALLIFWRVWLHIIRKNEEQSGFAAFQNTRGFKRTLTKAELAVLLLERERISRGYREGWLYFRCKESNLLEAYYRLIALGELQHANFDSGYQEDSTGEEKVEEEPISEPTATLEDSFKTLGIQQDASLEQIKKAYREQMKLYHPDKVASLGPELQRLATQMSQAISKAYNDIVAMKRSASENGQ